MDNLQVILSGSAPTRLEILGLQSEQFRAEGFVHGRGSMGMQTGMADWRCSYITITAQGGDGVREKPGPDRREAVILMGG